MKKFLLTAIVGFMALTAKADYYLSGFFNDWAPASEDAKFTEESEGVFVLDLEGPLSSGFKITDGWWSGALGGEGNMTIGVPYPLSSYGGNIGLEEVVENPHFVFKPAEMTLTITGSVVAAEYVYAVAGSIFGSRDQTEIMTEQNGVWSITKSVSDGEFQIQKLNKSANNAIDQVFDLTKGVRPQIGEPFSLTIPSMETETDGKIKIIKSGTATFSFNPEDNTLLITGDIEVASPADPSLTLLYLTGSFNNFNPAAAGYKFEASGNGIFVLDLKEPILTSDLFEITVGDWSNFYASNDSSNLVELGIPYTCKERGYNAMAVTTDIKEPRLTFNLNNLTLTIDDLSGVDTITADDGEAVYYNLQGIPTPNPEKGIYIRVVGGKAIKVVK